MPTAARKPIEQPTPTDTAPMLSEVVAPAAPTETEASLTPTEPATLAAAADTVVKPSSSSSSSSSDVVLKLLRRKRGATLGEPQEVTGWQAHSVRGFLSGTVRKRLGLALRSETGADGVRRYAVAKD